MAHLLKTDRVNLHVNLKQGLSQDQIIAYNSLIQRRSDHEPTAYITGHKEFFGLDFAVTPQTIIPRPDTEILVETAIKLANTALPQPCLVADIGTGCGPIAIALAKRLPQAKIYATDISPAALKVAKGNCLRHSVGDRVTLLNGDVLKPLPEPVHLIVTNLPYIREAELPALPPEISKFEPMIAFDGGKNGLLLIEKLMSQVEKKLLNGGALLIEIGYDQGLAVSELAKRYLPGASVRVVTDLSGLDRLVCVNTK